jgi:hypothetical protein
LVGKEIIHEARGDDFVEIVVSKLDTVLYVPE